MNTWRSPLELCAAFGFIRFQANGQIASPDRVKDFTNLVRQISTTARAHIDDARIVAPPRFQCIAWQLDELANCLQALTVRGGAILRWQWMPGRRRARG